MKPKALQLSAMIRLMGQRQPSGTNAQVTVKVPNLGGGGGGEARH